MLGVVHHSLLREHANNKAYGQVDETKGNKFQNESQHMV